MARVSSSVAWPCTGRVYPARESQDHSGISGYARVVRGRINRGFNEVRGFTPVGRPFLSGRLDSADLFRPTGRGDLKDSVAFARVDEVAGRVRQRHRPIPRFGNGQGDAKPEAMSAAIP